MYVPSVIAMQRPYPSTSVARNPRYLDLPSTRKLSISPSFGFFSWVNKNKRHVTSRHVRVTTETGVTQIKSTKENKRAKMGGSSFNLPLTWWGHGLDKVRED